MAITVLVPNWPSIGAYCITSCLSTWLGATRMITVFPDAQIATAGKNLALLGLINGLPAALTHARSSDA